MLERLPGLRRLVLNDVLPGPDAGAAACDGIAEDWFDSVDAMQLAFASPEAETVTGDVANFLDLSRFQMLMVGTYELFQSDAYWRDLVPSHEYFHGDTGRGVGVSHRTGWTGLVAKLPEQTATQMMAPRAASESTPSTCLDVIAR